MDDNARNHVNNPFRSPAWRWDRALSFSRRRLRVHRRGDEWIVRAHRLIVETANRGQYSARTKRCETDLAVKQALDIWRDGQSAKRWKLEALLLTQLPLEEIAIRCDTRVTTVEAYHELFFHVRPFVAARDWLMLKAVRCGPWNGFAGDVGGLWRYAAFIGGPIVLDAVIAITTSRPLPNYIAEALGNKSGRSLCEARLRALVGLTVAMITAGSNATELLRIRQQLDKLTGDAAENNDPVLALMGRFFGECRANPTHKRKGLPPIEKERSSATESSTSTCRMSQPT